MTIPGPECLCSLDENESIVAFNRMCPDHKHLAPKATQIKQPWCSGSQAAVGAILTKRTGRCFACGLEVPQKYGYAGVHLRDGTTPRE